MITVSIWDSENSLTRDMFLGGRLHIWQPRQGFRAGIDPVLLAATADASPGQSVLELGCGVGVASLCLAARVPELEITGLELQHDYASLARRNADENHLAIKVIDGDVRAMPPELRERSYDHVVANPPYFDRDRGTRSANSGKETALGEAVPLSDWVDAGIRRLVPKGVLHMILRADRLPELLGACDGRVGDICVLPLLPRRKSPARLVIFRARKGARGGFRLLAPCVLHRGDSHEPSGGGYTVEIEAVLRDGARLVADWT